MTHQDIGSSSDEATVVVGIVKQGDQRGRRLGFPTANLHDVGEVRRDGVYAATVDLEPDGPTYVAVVSVGHRPTYYGREGLRLLEAHLLGFHGDLYGHRVRVTLWHRIRPQRRFDTSSALIRQLQEDVTATAQWAARSGLGNLVTEPPATEWSRGRWGLDQRRLPRNKCRPTVRALKRTEAIVEAAQRAPADADPHQWVAMQTGFPAADIAWRLAYLNPESSPVRDSSTRASLPRRI